MTEIDLTPEKDYTGDMDDILDIDNENPVYLEEAEDVPEDEPDICGAVAEDGDESE